MAQSLQSQSQSQSTTLQSPSLSPTEILNFTTSGGASLGSLGSQGSDDDVSRFLGKLQIHTMLTTMKAIREYRGYKPPPVRHTNHPLPLPPALCSLPSSAVPGDSHPLFPFTAASLLFLSPLSSVFSAVSSVFSAVSVR